MDQAIAAEIRLKHTVERLESRLLEELHELPRTTGELEVPEATEPDAVEAFLVSLEADKDKRAPTFRALYKAIETTDATISLTEEQWKIIHGNQVVGETSSTKTRVDVAWFVGDAKELTLNIELETYKKDQILISGKDSDKLIERVLTRLGDLEKPSAKV